MYSCFNILKLSILSNECIYVSIMFLVINSNFPLDTRLT
jgi:hypothetical protein